MDVRSMDTDIFLPVHFLACVTRRSDVSRLRLEPLFV